MCFVQVGSTTKQIARQKRLTRTVVRLNPSWHKRAYTRRKKAKLAAHSPHLHTFERLQKAAHLLSRHHGSSIPRVLSERLAATAKSYRCPACMWEYSGKNAVKSVKRQGKCACGHAVGAAGPSVNPDKTKKVTWAQPDAGAKVVKKNPQGRSPATQPAAPSATAAKPTAKAWYERWQDAAPLASEHVETGDEDDGEDDGADAEVDVATATKEAADEKIARLKAEEVMLVESLALYRRHSGASSTSELISNTEENLKVCRSALQLMRPASTRVSQLTRAEKNRIRWLTEATDAAAVVHAQLIEVTQAYKDAVKQVEDAKDNLVDIQSKLERAKFEQEDDELVNAEDQALKLTTLLASIMKNPPTRSELQNQLAQACSIAESVAAAMSEVVVINDDGTMDVDSNKIPGQAGGVQMQPTAGNGLSSTSNPTTPKDKPTIKRGVVTTPSFGNS